MAKKIIRGTIEYEILLDDEWTADAEQESQIVENIKAHAEDQIHDAHYYGNGIEHWGITEVTSHVVLKTAEEE